MVFQPFAFHRAIHDVMPLRKYSESVNSSTSHGSGNVSSAPMAASNSIRLFVVAGSPPATSRTVSPCRNTAAQPPGPGLPSHPPSV